MEKVKEERTEYLMREYNKKDLAQQVLELEESLARHTSAEIVPMLKLISNKLSFAARAGNGSIESLRIAVKDAVTQLKLLYGE